jgi:hypothetical protein
MAHTATDASCECDDEWTHDSTTSSLSLSLSLCVCGFVSGIGLVGNRTEITFMGNDLDVCVCVCVCVCGWVRQESLS